MQWRRSSVHASHYAFFIGRRCQGTKTTEQALAESQRRRLALLNIAICLLAWYNKLVLWRFLVDGGYSISCVGFQMPARHLVSFILHGGCASLF